MILFWCYLCNLVCGVSAENLDLLEVHDLKSINFDGLSVPDAGFLLANYLNLIEIVHPKLKPC